MQDVNGNGLPDDEWYELKGSETGNGSTIQDYEVTYYRPASARSNVYWTDNLGNSGSVDYNSYHQQSSYYPLWMNQESYTLTGTRLLPKIFRSHLPVFGITKPMIGVMLTILEVIVLEGIPMMALGR